MGTLVISGAHPHLYSKAMKRASTLLAFVLLWSPPNANAIDEAESLDLLVTTLQRSDDPQIQLALMRGMLSGLAGRRQVQAPKGWSDLSQQLAASDDSNIRDLSMQLSQIFGDVKAMRRALAILQDTAADLDARRTALRSLLTQQNEEASWLLEALLDEDDLRRDAIRGYAMVENAAAPAVLLARYESMSPEARRAVVETLATRKRYAQALLEAVKAETVPKEDIPAHVARSLHNILGDPFVEVFGEFKPVAKNRERQIAKYKKMITPAVIATADASRGRAVFNKTCASCHVLYGEGAKIGPDLTGSNRANLDYILLNSVDPSYDVPEGYKMVLVETVDGRVLTGVVAEEDANRVVLKTVEQPQVVIAKADIESRRISPKSMMPDGQLEQMKPQELFDLIKYLRTTEQVEMKP